MRKTGLALIALLLGLAPVYSLELDAQGGHTRERLLPLTIKGATTRLLKVNWNGVPMLMKSYDSYRRLSLSRGINTIVVTEYEDGSPEDAEWKKNRGNSANASGGKGDLVDDVTIYADISPAPLKIIHTWDNAHNYVDLYVTEPSGETLYYAHRSSKLGGVMDIGADTVGYGPQIYTMPYPNKGVYEIHVSYWGGSRSELTEITTTVILHEGTEREERKVFQAFLTQPGNKIFIGKIEIE